ncbi:hypothetical protein CEXT_657561 [Caerostris extrusa]|uniref:Uncharacterized protein n=1 Tax=Caerostris extrusa TaxID=172846 RepID=A0AAV4W676_CAEEX|nr:hypothetical protein CEXT_657561 [Caerostris extrusa]
MAGTTDFALDIRHGRRGRVEEDTVVTLLRAMALRKFFVQKLVEFRHFNLFFLSDYKDLHWSAEGTPDGVQRRLEREKLDKIYLSAHGTLIMVMARTTDFALDIRHGRGGWKKIL